MDHPEQVLAAAMAAADAGAWTDALRLAGSLLVHDPLHRGALDVITVARRALELSHSHGAELRQMTIMFADVVGSTALVSKLGAESYRDLMLKVHEAAATAVSNFGGRIAQFLGDGILTYFSYPLAHEDDAQRAIYAGLELLQRLGVAAPAMAVQFGSAPALRLGVDTGRVVIGAAGAGQWTTVDSVFGDPPHVAARLQGLAPLNAIVVSEATRQLVKHHFVLEPLGLYDLAGYAQPVAVHRIVRAREAPSPELNGHAMLGREHESRELGLTWSSVLAGVREEMLVVGEAGLGKSRLVEQFANLATATGGRLVTIHCHSAFRHSAFHPVEVALRRLLHANEPNHLTEAHLRAVLVTAGVSSGVVSHVIALIANGLRQWQTLDVLPEQLRAGVFEAVIVLLEWLASTSLLLVVFENLHAADPSTLELVQVIRQRSTTRLLLLATTRSAVGAGAPWRRTLTLMPLLPAAARALVVRSAPELEDAKVDHVVERCGGIPLFLIAAARVAVSGASLLSIPTAATALLTQRISSLDVECRSAISDLSVVGIACSYSVLLAVSDLSAERLDGALARLLHDELLVLAPSAEGDVFQFRHVLYQEAAYDGQLLPARKRSHGRCADALIAEHARGERAQMPELVARHLVRADRTTESISWWQLAGARAAAAAAHTEAMAHFASGLHAVNTMAAGPNRAELEFVLQLSYGATCSAVLGYADTKTVQAFTRAAELGNVAPDGAALLPALWGIWSYYLVCGEHARARALADRCLSLAHAAHSSSLRAVAGAISGTQHFYLGNWDEAFDELRLACAASGDATLPFPQDPALASRAMLAVVEWVRGDTQAAERDMAAALSDAASLSGRQAEFTRAFVHCFAAWLAQLANDSARALSYAQKALEIAQRNQFATWIGAAALHMAVALTELGDSSSGLPLFVQALGAWRAAGARLMMPYFLGRYGRALSNAGRSEEGICELNDAIDLASVTGEALYDAELRRLHAEVSATNGAPRNTLTRQLGAAVRIAVEQRAQAFEVRARTSLASLDVEPISVDIGTAPAPLSEPVGSGPRVANDEVDA
ncbi:MAG: hypothetical protein RL701_6299 [Pseudomonadota bacterium]|jgi:class 3 adenylate cyclase/tetratricopeptide (TPR) repeat protein